MKHVSMMMITLLACFAYSTAFVSAQTRPDVQPGRPLSSSAKKPVAQKPAVQMGRFESF